ncbi:MAG TPA: neuraminidase-like domain-containing protein, partial [Longimicrobiaceae bacterium]|nr:neuraminidase-like domain-containing protein [Longimicrobiaceae bacterium]
MAAHFTRWRRLREVAAVRRALPASDTTLIDVFRLARTPGAELPAVLGALADATGWDRADLEAAASPDGLALLPTDLVNAAALPRLQAALGIARKLGVPATQMVGWARQEPGAAQAAAVRDAVKARYDEAVWVKTAAPIEDGLRERLRDALVAYVLQRPEVRAAGVADPNGLFEHFLIDVEMGSCMKTSRIRQAISSVQLFVQRCLLNLEPQVPPAAIDGEQWEWMKRYRVWEANRKVFLYPENWIEPELRDDKTPFFRELETDLLQSDVTEETAEQGLLHYLEKLDQVAKLEVAGLHHHPGGSGDPEVLHVFARTRSIPHVYFYRRRFAGTWTPWERMDVDIQGDHLYPIEHNRRIYLFWPLFEKIARQADNPPSSQDAARERYRVKLAWTEYRQGKWLPKRSSRDGAVTPIIGQGTGGWEASDMIVRREPSIPGADLPLWIDILRDRRTRDGLVDTMDVIASFEFRDCRNDVEVTHFENGPGWTYLVNPVGTRVAAMTLQSVPPPGPLSFLGPDGGAWGPVAVLNTPRGTYSVLPPPGVWNFHLGVPSHPGEPRGRWFFFQDLARTYFVESDGALPLPRMRFYTHFHPHVCELVRILNRSGLPGLLSLEAQKLDGDRAGNAFGATYGPTALVHEAYPREDVDFAYGGAYSAYNWELFFHAPMLIADRLGKEQRFAEAQRWFHHVFNPVGDFQEPAPQRYWRFLPFNRSTEEQRIQALLAELADPDGDPVVKEQLRRQIRDWRENPFQPHRIARLRLGAYQKSTVMKYLDNLIAWGDHLFAQDTLESINEATQVYVLAHHILGPRPERIPELAVPVARTYAQLKGSLDEFSNALAEVQNRFPFIATLPSGGSGNGAAVASGLGLGRSLYFGIPHNDKLLAYWDRVEDRLAKVRSCRNLEGITRSLALFEPPIDPALLVRARAAGLDVGSTLSDLSAPLGHYRFGYLLPRAQELCAEVRALGGALLAALEKRDSEALANLRQRQETGMLRLVRLVREQQVAEARAALEGLQRTRRVTEARHAYYRSLEYANPREQEHLQRLDRAQVLQAGSQIAELEGSVAALIPEFQIGASGIASPVAIADWGGLNMASSLQAVSRGLSFLASLETYQANRAATLGGWDRRWDDWKLQEELAARELAQIDKQTEAAGIRVAITERELENHDRQMENAAAVEEFMRDKFTSEELYGWMSAQLSALYFQAYQLAYAAAKRAERAYRFERGVTDSGFVRFGHWDSLRRGLLAGERLQLELKRLEMAYMDGNAREYELVRHVSLATHDPLALVALKETGRCHIRLPEALFDLDHPGHFMRRIRSVGVTIPCVTGPYTGINARLTLLSSRIRVDNTAAGAYPEEAEDPRFLADFSASQSIATSHGQNDSGLFELSFRDERYLPFEGAGAVSEWRLELPRETNAFDFDTITDVVLKVSYTAREGGELLRRTALEAAVLPPPANQPGAPSPDGLPAQESLQR